MGKGRICARAGISKVMVVEGFALFLIGMQFHDHELKGTVSF
jgi:uncharacterized membrane protein YiaA